MKPAAPPWCLHWEPEGELDPNDRLDLFLLLTTLEGGWSQQMLSQVASQSTMVESFPKP